jgi:hypothetical protein
MGLLYSKPFTNNHFHFLITVESATSQALIQQHKEMISIPENARRTHVVWIAVGTPAVDCAQVEEMEMAIRE